MVSLYKKTTLVFTHTLLYLHTLFFHRLFSLFRSAPPSPPSAEDSAITPYPLDLDIEPGIVNQAVNEGPNYNPPFRGLARTATSREPPENSRVQDISRERQIDPTTSLPTASPDSKDNVKARDGVCDTELSASRDRTANSTSNDSSMPGGTWSASGDTDVFSASTGPSTPSIPAFISTGLKNLSQDHDYPPDILKIERKLTARQKSLLKRRTPTSPILRTKHRAPLAIITNIPRNSIAKLPVAPGSADSPLFSANDHIGTSTPPLRHRLSFKRKSTFGANFGVPYSPSPAGTRKSLKAVKKIRGSGHQRASDVCFGGNTGFPIPDALLRLEPVPPAEPADKIVIPTFKSVSPLRIVKRKGSKPLLREASISVTEAGPLDQERLQDMMSAVKSAFTISGDDKEEIETEQVRNIFNRDSGWGSEKSTALELDEAMKNAVDQEDGGSDDSKHSLCLPPPVEPVACVTFDTNSEKEELHHEKGSLSTELPYLQDCTSTSVTSVRGKVSTSLDNLRAALSSRFEGKDWEDVVSFSELPSDDDEFCTGAGGAYDPCAWLAEYSEADEEECEQEQWSDVLGLDFYVECETTAQRT